MNGEQLIFQQPCTEEGQTHDLVFETMADGRVFVSAHEHGTRRTWVLDREQHHRLVAYLLLAGPLAKSVPLTFDPDDYGLY